MLNCVVFPLNLVPPPPPPLSLSLSPGSEDRSSDPLAPKWTWKACDPLQHQTNSLHQGNDSGSHTPKWYSPFSMVFIVLTIYQVLSLSLSLPLPPSLFLPSLSFPSLPLSPLPPSPSLSLTVFPSLSLPLSLPLSLLRAWSTAWH